jgi:hypothetical protein
MTDSLDPKFTPWRKWFAWRPVKVMDERWTWLRQIYRCELQGTWAYRPKHFYGTFLDVVKYPSLETEYPKPPKPPAPAQRPLG